MWTPQPKQELFLENPAYECGFGGAKGPGKTDALIVDGSAQLQKANYKAILFRRTFPQLEEIFLRTHKWFNHIAQWIGEKKCWTFPSGARFYLAHCQHEKDKYNHQGQEYNWIGFDQLETFTQTMYEFIRMQARTTDPSINCFIRSTCNPGGIGHGWVKKRFIDPLPHDGTIKFFLTDKNGEHEVSAGTKHAISRAFIFSTIYDNKHILENDPTYLANLMALPDAQRRAMLGGEWDAFEGQYFSEFERLVHVMSYSLFSLMSRELPMKKIISVDYGFKKPSAVLWHGIFPDGDMVTYKEAYIEGLTYEALIEYVLKINSNEGAIEYLVADPAIQGDKSHHSEVKDGDVKGESGYDIFLRKVAGKFPVLLADNRRVIGWTRMHEYLQKYDDRFGGITAKWRMTDNCLNLIRTLPGLIHSETHPEDVDSDGEDHAPDSARYAIMSRPVLPMKLLPVLTKSEKFWERVKVDIKKNNSKSYGQEEQSHVISDGIEDTGRFIAED